ncbi:hypothetical protein [Abyssalbus ytuae]|uniref:Secreted repeat protein with Y-X4-D motif n=1 Tax=Abyssalbus ytuae TaxID=2926907 RepID=A0A9E6ZPF4_9FLAO|nr:hypothetical protein [Abyssalbus ytuae]UOB18120.1 hypothetical protein MQE35_02195 [Abyssalbus ytuae]
MKRLIYLCVTFVFLLQSCGSDDDGASNQNPEPGENTVRLVDNSVHGKILTDSEGNTLYFFSRDHNGESACIDGCLDIWPVFYEESLTLDAGLESADFGEITRSDGAKQITYKGWPLYYFDNDNSPGDTNGDKINDIWYVAKPDYSLMYVQAQLVGRDANGNDVNYKSDYTPGDELTFYMTDAEGNTLYTFINDTKDNNNFTAEDFSNDGVWPVFDINIDKLPSILNPDDFGTINVFGKSQVAYKGWPLYYFGQDEERGDNYGINFPAAGVWPIANVDTTEAPNSVRISDNATHGNILTDAKGNSLYFFSRDHKGESACTDGCLDIWPVFYTDVVTLDAGFEASDFGEITRGDGSKQTTYKGWPLYYFENDNSPGDTNGDKVNDIWYVAKPDYSLMYVQAQLVGRDGDGNDVNYKSDYTPGDELTFYITDAEGNTLYTFINDTKDTNNFTAEDFSNDAVWPVFHIDIDKLPSILNAADFGTIDVYGRSQLTYKGWPLYYFGQDEERGDNYGINFPAAGVWPIANIDTPEAPAP